MASPIRAEPRISQAGRIQGPSRGTDAAGIDGWVKLYSGDGAGLFIDPADVNQVFVSATALSLDRATNGSRFSSAVSGITEPSDDFLTWPELIADPNDGRRLFLGGAQHPVAQPRPGIELDGRRDRGEERPGERDRSLSVRFEHRVFQAPARGTSTKATMR